MMAVVLPELNRGEALDMNNIFFDYQTHLVEYISEVDAQKYTHQKLKIKLKIQYSDTVQIYHVSSVLTSYNIWRSNEID